MTTQNIVVIISLIFGGTGIVGGLIALLKFRGESTKLFVDTASGLVLVQSGVVDELKERNAELRNDVTDLRGQIDTLTARLETAEKWHEEYKELERKYDVVLRERDELRRVNLTLQEAIRDQDNRMKQLEMEIDDLRRRTTKDRRHQPPAKQ